MAVAAAVWHILLMSGAANDNFMHMTMAQQWLAGDWPVRDFFDNGRLLQYSLSALAQLSIGDRLLGEALVVGAFWAISAYVVFVLVRQLTGSLPAAVLASLLLIVAGARGYSYPKGVVYAVAAVLWWAYVRRPRVDTMVVFGAWVAVAYYWRPDHGVYTAFALVLAAIAAHGVRPETVMRVAVGGATTLALVAPFWIFIHSTVGLPDTPVPAWRRHARNMGHTARTNGRSCDWADARSWWSHRNTTHRSSTSAGARTATQRLAMRFACGMG